ncbi:MAG: DUF2156 domain-containing protein [Oscillospiraceae bacterium]
MSALEFTKLELEHIPLIRPFFLQQNRRICDCTVGSTLMWRNYFDNCFAIVDDTLIFRSRYLDGQFAFTVPIGKNPQLLLEQTEEYCRDRGIPLEFCTVTPNDLELLRSRWPDLKVEENRDWYDYLYESRDMVEFAGRKYAAQRNHIHRFERDCPDWSFERMTADHVEEVRSFYRGFLQERTKEGETAQAEVGEIFEVLDHFDAYAFLGGILRVDGKIVGISMGEIVRDTLYVHIEKADVQYSGVYQKLVNCFAREYVTDEVRYINREEDVGDPGLRKSKLSYHPIALQEKYTVRVER